MDYLNELPTNARINLILTDPNTYIALMQPHHIDILLNNLAATDGLTPQDITDARRDTDPGPDWQHNLTLNTRLN